MTVDDGSFHDLMKLVSLSLVFDACSDVVISKAILKSDIQAWKWLHRALQLLGLFWGAHFV